jgi:hypothetical protein
MLCAQWETKMAKSLFILILEVYIIPYLNIFWRAWQRVLKFRAQAGGQEGERAGVAVVF